MKQALGPRKTRRCAEAVGRPVRVAYTRGGWTHHVANAFCEDGTAWWVNYKTGDAWEDTAPTTFLDGTPVPPNGGVG